MFLNMNYNQKVGQFGERLAKNYLIRQGYKIIDSNIKISYKEIDIVAKLGKEFIFIEVKTRTSGVFGGADEGINSRKIHCLKKALSMYINDKKLDPENIRVDLIAVDIDKIKKVAKIKHYKNII